MKLAADGQAGAIENDDKEIAQAIERSKGVNKNR
jgi:hypothetical protein